MEAQAIGRCHRIGQKQRVEVHRFYIREVQGAIDQIEAHMKMRQEEKKALALAVISPEPATEESGIKMVSMVDGKQRKPRATVAIQKLD